MNTASWFGLFVLALGVIFIMIGLAVDGAGRLLLKPLSTAFYVVGGALVAAGVAIILLARSEE